MASFPTLLTYFESRIRRNHEQGAAAVEYGLLLTFIAAVIVVAVQALGVKTHSAFTTITGLLP